MVTTTERNTTTDPPLMVTTTERNTTTDPPLMDTTTERNTTTDLPLMDTTTERNTTTDPPLMDTITEQNTTTDPPPSSGWRNRRTRFNFDRLLLPRAAEPHASEETSEPSHEMGTLPTHNRPGQSSRPSEDLLIDITINRACCLFSIIGLGFGGGWSCLPDEKRVPTSAIWVLYSVVLADCVAVTTVLDCLWPNAMNWYFRSHLRPKFLHKNAENNPPSKRTKITLYRVGTTLLVLGYLIARVIMRHDDRFLNTTNLIALGLGICAIWIGWIESDNSGRRWLFWDDYREHLFVMVTFFFGAVTFFFGVVTRWWVTYRLTAVAIILRHRNNEEMKLQFHILMIGIIVEGIALCTFFAIPILRVFKNIPWHKKLWHSHLVTSIAMLVIWAFVLIVGFGDKLFYVLFPCTDSKSAVCSILISYL